MPQPLLARSLRLLAVLLLLVAAWAARQEARAQLAVRADTVYTMTGDGAGRIVDGVVLVEGGQITAVGPAREVAIPDGYEVREAVVVTPGFIDARSVVGLAGIYNTDADQDQLDTSAPIQPELRAVDAYNAREALVAWLRRLGVTTVHTGHGPGALVSGQTMIVKTTGATAAEAVVREPAMLAMTLATSVESNFESPGTRAKRAALLRQAFVDAQAYAEKRAGENPPPRHLGHEALARVLAGEMPALVTAHRAHDITAALRLADEFGFEMVLDGGAEAYDLTGELSAAGVPVIVHPTMIRTVGDAENAAFTTAGVLHRAGLAVAFQSGYEGYVPKTRVVPFEAAIAVAHGMGRAAALRALTLDAARLLGIAERVGSLAPGKDADLALFNGDPLEYTTQTCTVIIDGAVVSDACQ